MPKPKKKKLKKAVANESRRKRKRNTPKRPAASAPRKPSSTGKLAERKSVARNRKPAKQIASTAKRKRSVPKRRTGSARSGSESERILDARKEYERQYREFLVTAKRLRDALKRESSPAKRHARDQARELANLKAELFIAQSREYALKLEIREQARKAAAETTEKIRDQYERKAAREERRRRAAFDESTEVQEILERQDDESIAEYISRVDKEMSRRGFHHDAWYMVGAEQFGETNKDFYSTIMGSPPKLGA